MKQFTIIFFIYVFVNYATLLLAYIINRFIRTIPSIVLLFSLFFLYFNLLLFVYLFKRWFEEDSTPEINSVFFLHHNIELGLYEQLWAKIFKKVVYLSKLFILVTLMLLIFSFFFFIALQEYLWVQLSVHPDTYKFLEDMLCLYIQTIFFALLTFFVVWWLLLFGWMFIEDD